MNVLNARAKVRLDDAFGLGVGLTGHCVVHAGLRRRCGVGGGSQHGALVVADVHGDIGGQAHAQRVTVQFLIIQRNTHGYTLHDLDPVARGVLRRQQRKRRAGTRAQPDHLAVEFRVAAIQVRADLRALANADVAQLAFLEVRVDPQIVQRHHGHQLLSWLHAVAELYAALDDVTGDRRDDGVALRGHPCGAKVRPRLLYGGVVGHVGALDACVCGRRLCLRHLQRRLSLRHTIAQVLHDLWRLRLRGNQRQATLEVGLRLAHVNLSGSDCRITAAGRIRLLAYLAYGLRQHAAGLTQAHLCVGTVQLHQSLPGTDVLRVVGKDRDHRTGYLRRDRHLIAANVRVVGGDPRGEHKNLQQHPDRAAEHKDRKHDEQRATAFARVLGGQSAVMRLLGCGFVRRGGISAAHARHFQQKGRERHQPRGLKSVSRPASGNRHRAP